MAEALDLSWDRHNTYSGDVVVGFVGSVNTDGSVGSVGRM
jgi:hypothetical protein